jgi:hypothetical protein
MISNSFDNMYKKGEVYKTLFGLKSLINHNRETNLKIEWISPDQIFIFALEDIPED